MAQSPPLIITAGDPAGIGPEIALKALANHEDLRGQTILMGDIAHLETLADSLGYDAAFMPLAQGQPLAPSHINVMELSWPETVVPGQPNPANAPVIIHSIETAAQLCLNGEARGLITCPISKSVLYDAGFTHPGHTEFLGTLSAVKKEPIMMLANDELRVVPATIHMALKDVASHLDAASLSHLIGLVATALRDDFGISAPRIAICGLNPHAGEKGAMGDEEIHLIEPAIEQARMQLASFADISQATPADTLFHPEKRARYDCVIGMYHDQVLIPVKTIDFHGTVNITLGLDFVRTSPDHGTAFDIAGKGIARPDSLINAIRMAADIAHHRGQND